MMPISLPATRRASIRSLRILIVAFAVAALVAPLAADPASAVSPAGWSTDTPVAGALNTRPVVAKDADGHLGVAWQEMSSSAGIMFATDATGSWVTQRVSAGDDWAPDLVFDAGGAAHVVFVRFGTGAGLYHATNATGAWVTTPIRADAVAWAPSLAIDAGGSLRVAYASEGFTPGIWYLTNTTGSWVATRVTTGTWDSEPSLALDPGGKAHIAFARYDRPSPGLLVATNATGSWVTTRLTTNADLDDDPTLLFDAAGYRHIAAWRSLGEDGDALVYATDSSGTWQAMTVGMPSMGIGIGIPAIGLDGSGAPEIVVRLAGLGTDDDTLWRFSDLPWGAATRLMVGAERDEEFPDILRDASGRLVVVYRGAWHAPGIVLHREDPDEDAMVASSVLVGSPSLRSDGAGAKHLAFERYATDATDGTSYATNASGAWVDETIGATHGAPSLGITYGPVRRVAIPDRLYSNDGMGWEAQAFEVAGGTDVDFDDQPTSISSLNWKLAYLVPDVGIRVMHAGLNEELAVAWSWDESPDIVAGGAGSEHYLLAFTDKGRLTALRRYWQDPLLETPQTIDDAEDTWSPTAALGDVGSVSRSFIAYDRGGLAAGIYLADDATYTGEWKRRRLSRAYADVTPTIASFLLAGIPGQDSSVYVTWARVCGGPSPGIYVATNRTGTWVTRQLVSSCDVYDPSLTVLPDGRMSIAYFQDPGGIVVLTESSLAGTSAREDAVTTTRSSRALDATSEASTANGGAGFELTAAGATLGRGSPTVSRTQLAERFSSADR